MVRHTLFFLLFFFFGKAQAQSGDWILKKESDGIQAYVKKVDNSSFDEYRVTMILSGDKEDVLSIIRDHTQYEELYHNVKDVRSIKNESNLFINYAHIDTPFPAKDREAVYKNQIGRPTESKIKVTTTCITDFYEPNRRKVQITDCHGHWLIEQLANDEVRVTQQMLMNPGGKVPSWIANKYVVKEPIRTFKRLKLLLNDVANKKKSK